MCQDELRREARLIVQGRQAWVHDLVTFWTRLAAWLGVGVAKAASTELRLH